MSVARARHNGTGRRTCGEWGALVYDRDRWHQEAAELERALAAVTSELYDALALATLLDRREGPRRILVTDSRELRELREGYGRRHDDTFKLSVCQCSNGWNVETRRYEDAQP